MSSFDNFTRSLKDSQGAVEAVARYLVSRGFEVHIPELHIPADQADCISDHGDLICRTKKGEFVIEVKGHPGLEWGNFEWCVHGLIIEKVSVWDNKDPKPHAYYILDKHLKEAMVFNVDKWDLVYQVPIRDRQSGLIQPNYLAHPKYFKMINIEVEDDSVCE